MIFRRTTFFLLLSMIIVYLGCSSKPDVQGLWIDSAGGSLELLSDGTAILSKSKNQKMTGKWSILEDGRLKMEYTVFGVTSTILLKVSVKGDNMEVVDQDGDKEIFKRKKS